MTTARRAPLRDLLLGYHWLAQERLFRRTPLPADPNDRRILILVTGFPPDVSGGVYRPAALARYARRNGWEPTVVTWAAPSRPGAAGQALLEYVGRDLTVLRTSDPPVDPSHRLYPKVDGSMIRAVEMARLARRHFGRDLPRTVFCSGPSFSPFVAGWFLTADTDRKLVLEYRDEWTLCPFDFVSKEPHDVVWERRCLSRANLVVTMTASQREALTGHFGPGLRLPEVAVVANGWEPAFMETRTPPPADGARPGRVVITFAGKLGDYTHPGRFLGALEQVLRRRPDLAAKLEVRFVGMKDANAARALSAFGVDGVVRSIDPVPQAVAGAMMRESQALLLIHNRDFERYIPGKIYEYAASGSPILLFDDSGESDRIVRELALGHSLQSDDLPAFEHALESICDSMPAARRGDDALRDKRQAWIDRHRREVLAQELFGTLDRALNADDAVARPSSVARGQDGPTDFSRSA